MSLKSFISESEKELSDEEFETNRIISEIDRLKKKRILPILLMTVFGWLIIPLIVGAIMLVNVNEKIYTRREALSKLEHDWISQ